MLRNFSGAHRRARVLQEHLRMLQAPMQRTSTVGGRFNVTVVPSHRHFSCSSFLSGDTNSKEIIDFSSMDKSSELMQDDSSLLDVVEESSIEADSALEVDSALEAVDQSFHFTDIFSIFPNTVESILQYVHATTGMPWWLTIAACTIAVRSAMVPLMIHMRSMSKRIMVIKPRLDELKNKVSEYQMVGDYVRMQESSVEMKKFMKQHNVKPWMSVLPMFVQGSLFASFFFGLRHLTMSDTPTGGLTSEGGLWFSDLTLPDPYFIMPIANCAFISASLWLNMTEAGEVSEQMETLKPVMYIFNGVFLFICAKFPSGVVLYMVTSSLYSLVYATITKKILKNSGPEKKVELITPEKARKAGEIRRIVRDSKS